jgi:hypothetical protein
MGWKWTVLVVTVHLMWVLSLAGVTMWANALVWAAVFDMLNK